MTRTTDRTHLLLATAVVATVLLLSPLSGAATAAIALAVAALAIAARLTANPVHVVRAEAPAHRERSPRR